MAWNSDTTWLKKLADSLPDTDNKPERFKSIDRMTRDPNSMLLPYNRRDSRNYDEYN